MQEIAATNEHTIKIKTKKNKNTSFWVRNNYNTNNWWKPGQPITENDLKLLEKIKIFYEENGYSPTKDDVNDIEYIIQLKDRFRTWGNILLAAGLPERNDPENVRKRQQALERRKSETAE